MSLSLLQHPAREPVTVAEAKAFLRIEDAHQDELIKKLIKTARLAVEAFTARSLIHQSWRFTVNAGFCVAKSNGGFLSGHYPRSDQGIDLPRSPFVELLSCPKLIDPYRQSDLHDYKLDHAGRIAKISFGKTLSLEAMSNSMVQIDFKAGYSEGPQDVPEPLKHGILLMVAELFENRVTSNDNQGAALPLSSSAVCLIQPYRVQRLG